MFLDMKHVKHALLPITLSGVYHTKQTLLKSYTVVGCRPSRSQDESQLRWPLGSPQYRGGEGSKLIRGPPPSLISKQLRLRNVRELFHGTHGRQHGEPEGTRVLIWARSRFGGACLPVPALSAAGSTPRLLGECAVGPHRVCLLAESVLI